MLVEEQVLEIIPVSRSTLWRMERTGKFPRSTYISSNRRVWFEDQIVDWQNSVDERNPNRGRGKGRRNAQRYCQHQDCLTAMSEIKNPASGGTLDRAYSEIAGCDDGINSTANPNLQAALAYARRGWNVFPAVLNSKKSHKAAAHSGGAKWGATNNADQIAKDFAKWPTANIGIATGPGSGIFVLDVDTIKGHGVDGGESLTALEAANSPLPDTLRSQSPSGGVHYFFNYPTDIELRNSEGKIGDGLDVRGMLGIVIAPPSAKGSEFYSWQNGGHAYRPRARLADRGLHHERDLGSGADATLRRLLHDPPDQRARFRLCLWPRGQRQGRLPQYHRQSVRRVCCRGRHGYVHRQPQRPAPVDRPRAHTRRLQQKTRPTRPPNVAGGQLDLVRGVPDHGHGPKL